MRSRIDKRAELTFVNDVSFYIKRRLNILGNNLLVGLALVTILLSLLLPWKVALLVSVGIPFSFLGTMIYFYACDHTINLISLIGFIIVSGMLVDDAIVVTDNCVREIEEGDDHPTVSSIRGAFQIWQPVTASVATTIVVFLPMMYMSGIFGKFVRQMPIAVIAALLVSLIEAFFILPGHIAYWVDFKKKGAGETPEAPAPPKKGFAVFWENQVVPRYLALLKKVLHHRYLFGGAGAAFVIFSIWMGTQMPKTLFPAKDIDIFIVRAQAPPGSSLAVTESLLKPIETSLNKLDERDLDNFKTTIGMHNMGLQVLRRGPEFAQIFVFLNQKGGRTKSAEKIIEELRTEFKSNQSFTKLSIERLNPGPPVGKPINIGARAKNYEDILPAIEYLEAFLKKIPGVMDFDNTYIMGPKEFQVKVKPDEAAAAGISVGDIGNTVRAAFEGLVSTTVKTLDEEIDVRVSLSKKERTQNDTLQALRVPNRAGNLIPLAQVAEIKQTQSLSNFEHEDHERQIKITGDVDESVTTASAVAAKVREILPEMKKKFPKVTVAFGGEDRDTQESMASLGRAFLVAAMGVLLILVLTFRNLLQPMLVFGITIPLGISAAIWAFQIHRMPLTFLGMMGVIALAGVVVNNAIVFVDFVNQNRRAGKDRFDSILSSAKVRLRPVVLTTLTTAVGLMPTSYGIGGYDPFVTYITVALSWGLLIGSALISFLLPSGVAILDDLRILIARLRKREPRLIA